MRRTCLAFIENIEEPPCIATSPAGATEFPALTFCAPELSPDPVLS